jgi:hypothetical protein
VLTVRHFPGQGQGRALGTTEVWAGDGHSRVWVLHLPSGKPIVPPISTALGGPGTDPNRADELCYDPDHGIILIANPNSTPNGFVTFISTSDYKVLGHIVMDGTGGKPKASGGIEQCQYSPRTKTFYLNVPKATDVSSFTTPQDLVLQIDPVKETILNTLNLTQKSSTTDGCVAPPGRTAAGTTGMALGPDHQIAIACGTTAPGSVVITEDFGTLYSLKGETGADEIWYNPGDNHYFYATVFQGGKIILGVVDAFGDTSSVPVVDTVATPPVAISTKAAADPVANQVYAAVNPTNAKLSKICSSHGGDDTKGCIAVFTVVSGTDDPGASN